MDEILKKIDEQQIKIDSMYQSVEKLRKYFLWTLVVTVVTFVLPIVVMLMMLPSIMSSLTGAYGLGM